LDKNAIAQGRIDSFLKAIQVQKGKIKKVVLSIISPFCTISPSFCIVIKIFLNKTLNFIKTCLDFKKPKFDESSPTKIYFLKNQLGFSILYEVRFGLQVPNHGRQSH